MDDGVGVGRRPGPGRVGPEQPADPAPRRGGFDRGSLLGLARMEPVQKELALKEEQVAKVKKISDDLMAEMRKEYTALRDIKDAQKRREKMTELRDQFDKKAREQLGGVLAREQMIRLYQIRTQYRPVMDTLGSTYVAGKLKLTDEQKTKIAQIAKDVQEQRTKLFSSMRDATQEQRTEAYGKYRTMRTEADKKALDVLTDEQKKALEAMKGKKLELQSTRRRPQST